MAASARPRSGRTRRASRTGGRGTSDGGTVQLSGGDPGDPAIPPDDDRQVVLLVLANRVADGQPDGLVDLPAVGKDLGNSVAAPSLHRLPPPGYVARHRHLPGTASLFQHPKRSIVVDHSNCRTGAMSPSKTDRAGRNCAGPSDSGDARFPLARYGLRGVHALRPWRPQSQRSAPRGIPGGTDNQLWSASEALAPVIDWPASSRTRSSDAPRPAHRVAGASRGPPRRPRPERAAGRGRARRRRQTPRRPGDRPPAGVRLSISRRHSGPQPRPPTVVQPPRRQQ